jgi:hypothetical protein
MSRSLARAAAAAGLALALAGCYVNDSHPVPVAAPPPSGTVYVAPSAAPPGTVIVKPAY